MTLKNYYVGGEWYEDAYHPREWTRWWKECESMFGKHPGLDILFAMRLATVGKASSASYFRENKGRDKLEQIAERIMWA